MKKQQKCLLLWFLHLWTRFNNPSEVFQFLADKSDVILNDHTAFTSGDRIVTVMLNAAEVFSLAQCVLLT